MKKNLLLLTILFSAFNSYSQCSIDPSITDPGTYPAQMPPACVGRSYTETADLVFAADTALNVPPFGSINIPFDSIIMSVPALPSGLTTICSNSSCTIIGSSGELLRGCIQFIGTPEAVTIPGNSIAVDIQYYLTILGSSTILNDVRQVMLDVNAAPDTTVTIGFSPATLTATATSGTFQWYDCTVKIFPIVGATDAVFVPVAAGSYTVEVTNGPCSAFSSCYTITSLAVEELNAVRFNVYPNPGNGTFHIPALGNMHKSMQASITDLT